MLPILKLADPPEPGEQFHFDPKLCCCHNWVYMLDDKRNPTGQEYCPDCGATCVRDRRTNLIEEYDAVAGFGKKVRAPGWKRDRDHRGSYKEKRPFNHHPRPGRS